jgi:uncharacterized protein (TIGR03083 family)
MATAGSKAGQLLDPHVAGSVAEAARARTAEVVAALSPKDVTSPSMLPGWDRLTIACHLRYGARASLRMTEDSLSGEATSFYPQGRSAQRPGTLAPDPGETPAQVLASLGEESTWLHETWSQLTVSDWSTVIEEPLGSHDLGSTTISQIALLRLTEVEVHGSDLGIGLGDWSDVFVATALPTRIGWLATRRSNHRAIDPAVQGSWLFVSEIGCWRVEVRGSEVSSGPAEPTDRADCEMHAPARDLLATLLGRPTRDPISIHGNADLAQAFGRAFPGP